MVMRSGLTEAGTARPWPAERIEYWAIERLIPYADNARLHSEADIDKACRLASPMGMDQPRVGRRGRQFAGGSRTCARSSKAGADVDSR